jgi:indole-3-glycerol phosphate synthase
MILNKIAESTRARVAKQKLRLSAEAVREIAEALPYAAPDFVTALRTPGLSLICEVKKASPSKGVIAEAFDHMQTARDYAQAGASAISVLTEPEFFLGSDEYLREIAAQVKIPCLRKDFIVDPYQIYDAKMLGAAAVLLICALLDKTELKEYIGIAESLGLAALVECHDAAEVTMALEAGAAVVGVNNRDLRTFHVDINTCLRLRALVPRDRIYVAESGITTLEDTKCLMNTGVDAALIGEALMRTPDKAKMIGELRWSS